MRSRLLPVIAVAIFALALTPAAHSQSQITTGVIQGAVSDPNGAVLPGATVEVVNLDTNLTRNVTTDEDGRFSFLQLPSGRYSLNVTKEGFAKLIQSEFPLTVGQTISLDVDMKVTGVEGQVTITSIPTVDTVKTESSTTINEQAVSNLPVLGRKFEDLLTLTPNVSIVQGPDGDEINFAGQRGVFNNVSLDGGDYNNGFFGEQAGGQRAAIDIPLDAVKEFQVIATGASAEFGRTAGGVVNVITKSGTNEFHGSLFHFQRLEGLTANTSDGKSLTDFHREQFGANVGGPIKRDKAFFFISFESIRENLTRANLSEQVGDTPCPVQTPTILANEGLINGNTDCQRLALLNFFRTTRDQEEGLPIQRPIRNSAILGKMDWDLNSNNRLTISHNFDYSKNTNQTFDVATYGNSANGIEGPSKINAFNANFFSTLSPTKVNEFHFTYARENRPRSAVESNIPADTAMGFGTTFRFGHPFFLQPNVDEIFWRTQIKDNISIVTGRHTVKFGGEWVHSLNSQVFRGFFQSRYIFGSVAGFLRYASPAAPGGFGPQTVGCSDGSFVTAPDPCPGGSAPNGFPLLLYLQGAGRTGPATDAAGFSEISNEDIALFAQDRWQVHPRLTLNYGLRWEAQLFPEPVVDPSETAYGLYLNDPRFPSDGTLHDQKKMFQPRFGFAWDITGKGKSVLRGSYGVYFARQNMLTQVGSITTNGVQQQTIFRNTFLITALGFSAPTWPGGVTPTADTCTDNGITNPFPCGSGVRVFSRDYANPRVYTTNIAFEQELASNLSLYLDFTHAKGVHLTRFLDYARTGFFAPFLGETMVTSANGKSLYRGFTVGVRKRYSRGFQLEGNYTFSKDQDDDSNERDPFNDRSFGFPDNLQLDYALADRDIRHRFNFYTNVDLPAGFDLNARVQARTAQPRSPNCVTLRCFPRNTIRKNNEFFSFDWRLQRPFSFSENMKLIPIFEMFNTFNNDNNIDPTIGDPLFNFDGFLRQGVGDPLQVQLGIKFVF